MVQNSTLSPTVLMQKEIEPVVDLKYIIMRRFDNIICITVLPWQHEFIIFGIFHLHNACDKKDPQSVCQFSN